MDPEAPGLMTNSSHSMCGLRLVGRGARAFWYLISAWPPPSPLVACSRTSGCAQPSDLSLTASTKLPISPWGRAQSDRLNFQEPPSSLHVGVPRAGCPPDLRRASVQLLSRNG
jgi:hypothetical protein